MDFKLNVMKEIFEFRVNYDFAAILFRDDEGVNLGNSVKVVKLQRDDPRFSKIPLVAKEVKRKYGRGFYFGWNIERKYSKKELMAAKLFQVKIKSTFEPAGEECGTEYDESTACKICGANRTQKSPLRLQKSSIPKKDVARTIAGEVVVSDKFKRVFENKNLKGIQFDRVYSKNEPINFFQPISVAPELTIAENTIVGVDPFDLSERCGDEIYKCPAGHTIGLNLLSEIYVEDIPQIMDFDFFVTEQKVGVKRGLLRPEPLYLCSQEFRKMVLAKALKGFEFEVAHIVG